jgi:hypothetical protein
MRELKMDCLNLHSDILVYILIGQNTCVLSRKRKGKVGPCEKGRLWQGN